MRLDQSGEVARGLSESQQFIWRRRVYRFVPIAKLDSSTPGDNVVGTGTGTNNARGCIHPEVKPATLESVARSEGNS